MEVVMAFVICEPCVGEKTTNCVSRCPVDAIHPTETEPGFAVVNQLFINPEACVDCGLCVDACPVAAIYPRDEVPAEWNQYIADNAAYYGQ
jgi:ferredoxin